MDIHGVDVTEHLKKGNMPLLYDQMRKAERILNY
jgi:hypothetical protein